LPGQTAVLVVRLPGCFGCHESPAAESCTVTLTWRRVSVTDDWGLAAVIAAG
jgi:hypothetical protein